LVRPLSFKFVKSKDILVRPLSFKFVKSKDILVRPLSFNFFSSKDIFLKFCRKQGHFGKTLIFQLCQFFAQIKIVDNSHLIKNGKKPQQMFHRMREKMKIGQSKMINILCLCLSVHLCILFSVLHLCLLVCLSILMTVQLSAPH
jgi:hypothetical protein